MHLTTYNSPEGKVIILWQVLLAHPDITDAAVLGVEDPTWGQKVAGPVQRKCPQLSNQKCNVFDAGGCCFGVEIRQPQDGVGGGEKVGQWQATQLPSAQGSQVRITLLIVCVSHDHFRILSVMPRNAMGKVNKKELLKTVFEDQISKWIFNVVQ